MGKIQNESGAPYGAGKEGNANKPQITEGERIHTVGNISLSYLCLSSFKVGFFPQHFF